LTRCRTTRAFTTTRRERLVRREAERLAARPRPNLPARVLRAGCANPPAFSAAARAWAMNGRERLPRERMRPSRMCRSSSRVITFRARGALLPLFTMTCANWQAVVRRRTLCQVFDHCPLSVRPTAAHLAAFILPSHGCRSPPSCPFATGAKFCKFSRSLPRSVIAASDRTISARTGCRQAPWPRTDVHW